jgi:aspartate 1-decarboxylase
MKKSKIHRATITEADLNYIGSITIDESLMESSNIIENEKVLVVDINNGARFETYVITGERNSGVICLNGGAARLVHTGDKVIIIAFGLYDENELKSFQSINVFVDDFNKIVNQ